MMSTLVTTPMTRPDAAKARAPGKTAPEVPTPAETSFELVKRACGGDVDAENEVCRRYLPRLHKWAHGRVPVALRPSVETADVVQEVLIKAVRTFSTFEVRHEHSFPAFLRTVLANKLRDLARVDMRRPAPRSIDDVAEAASREASPFDVAAIMERQRRFDAAMKTLAAADQELIFLRTELGYDYEEMVELLGRSNANATRVAVRRAIIRLGKEMARTAGSPR